MNVLIACEYSGIVRNAFLSSGHHVLSCDLLPGEFLQKPEQHYQGNLFDVLYEGWDLIIAFPPCTYLCKAQAARILHEPGRKEKQEKARDFFFKIADAPADKIAIENPVGHINSSHRLPDQMIHPWMFGDPYQKEICLWLKNLPPLISTIYNTKRKSVSNHVNSRMSQALKSKIKSKFFPGIADAMAHQWAGKMSPGLFENFPGDLHLTSY